MGKISGEAGRPGQGAPRRRGGEAARSGGGRTVRLQLHLGEQTAQRLGVHCSLVARDRSHVAEEILRAWLSRFGRGREIFGPVDTTDRPDPAVEISPAAPDPAA